MRTLALAMIVLVPIVASGSADAEDPVVLQVWPREAPGEPSGIGDETDVEGRPGERVVRRITNVTVPTISVHRPADAANTGTAVLIAPGGGYNILAWDLEGEEVAAWLNRLGVTGIVLKYRVPRRPGAEPGEPPIEPFQDAQRAMSLVRSRASEWGIHPERIGILGFSAGGHLAARVLTNFDQRSYDPIDEVDQVTCRPDFGVLLYPAYLVEADSVNLRPMIRVSDQSPPCFFVHAGDDRLSAANSIGMYLALKEAGVPSELHVYAQGGHGFGLRPSDAPVSTWPDRCAAWFRSRGWLDAE